MLSGEPLLIIEGEERPLRQWDFVHCPAATRHIIVGAGAGSDLTGLEGVGSGPAVPLATRLPDRPNVRA